MISNTSFSLHQLLQSFLSLASPVLYCRHYNELSSVLQITLHRPRRALLLNLFLADDLYQPSALIVLVHLHEE
jgi:hypothetical protein